MLRIRQGMGKQALAGHLVMPSIYAWLLGAALALGSLAAVEGFVSFSDPRLYLRLLLFTAASQIAFCVGERLLNNASSGYGDERSVAFSNARWINRFEYVEGPTSVLRDGLRIYICWLPYVLLLFPGVIYWDTGDQLAQFFGLSAFGMDPGQIWDHHPFFDAYLYGWFLQTGHSLAGSYDAGTFVFSLAQSYLAAVSFAWALAYLVERGASPRLVLVIRSFIRFFPVFPVAFVVLVKDVTHVVFFLQWCILFSKIVRTHGRSLRSPRFLFLVLAISLLCSLTKKTALYIVVLCLMGLWLCLDGIVFKLTAAGLAVVVYLVVQTVLPTYLYPALNVIPGGPQAAIVVPIEQVARVARYYPEDVTAEEKDAIDSYLLTGWDYMGANYNPYIADPVTAYNVKDKTGTGRFMKAWLSIGLRHPGTYINAFLVLESGWISFSSAPTVDTPVSPYTSVPLQVLFRFSSNTNPSTFGRVHPDSPASSGSAFIAGLYNALKDLPVVNLLFSIALWTICIPAFILSILRKLRRANNGGSAISALIEFSPYFVSIGTLFLYAVSLSLPTQDNPSRYMFHAIVLAPFYLGLLSTHFNKKSCEFSS